MDFTFTEDQLLFQDTVRDCLTKEVTPTLLRSLWDSETGRSDALWQQLAELGLTGMTVPEAEGGLGFSAVDFVLLAQECGYVALPENLVETVLVAVPLLAAVPDEAFRGEWLGRIAAGEARVAVGPKENPLVEDAHVADLLLLQHGGEVHAVTPDAVTLTANESVDPGRRLFRVEWTPSETTCVVPADEGEARWAAALNGGALGVAAQCLGLAQRMVDMSVQYSTERQQFGKPIGSFQAVKHRMANAAVALEYSKAPVYRAAYAVTHDERRVDTAVSHAKLAASEAALLAAKNSIQVHGAMGYTWEVDLHIFMKKAWALDAIWGDRAFHKQRIAERLFRDSTPIGAGQTFAA